MPYNSTLKRKMSLRDCTLAKMKREGRQWPQKPSGAPKPRKPLKRASSDRQREMDAYFGQRSIFLRRFPVCAACLTRGISPAPSTQVHHSRGRVNKLLRDERFWIAVCADCHEWIHSNGRAARDLGLLSSATDFNRRPRE